MENIWGCLSGEVRIIKMEGETSSQVFRYEIVNVILCNFVFMCVFRGNIRQFYLLKTKATFILSVSITSQLLSNLDWGHHQEY